MPLSPGHHGGAKPSGPPTTLTTPRLDRWVMFLGFPATGVALSVLLPVLARWLLDLGTGLPVKPVFWFLGEIDNWWRVLAAAAVGALVGLGGAAAAAKRTATVTVGDADLVLEVGGRRQTMVRGDVDAVFLDGENLVVQGTGARRLLSAPLRTPRHTIAQAFREHSYRWLEDDPYSDQYRHWSPGRDDLPTEVDAVLAARETALKKRSTIEVHNLTETLQQLGYAVREEGKRQYWRPLPG